jgi:hypothetical protein
MYLSFYLWAPLPKSKKVFFRAQMYLGVSKLLISSNFQLSELVIQDIFILFGSLKGDPGSVRAAGDCSSVR